jgi:hypothetical protein
MHIRGSTCSALQVPPHVLLSVADDGSGSGDVRSFRRLSELVAPACTVDLALKRVCVTITNIEKVKVVKVRNRQHTCVRFVRRPLRSTATAVIQP